MLEILLNGESCKPTRSQTVADLVVELELPAPVILIEHNACALRRDEWERTPLGCGDRIEILRVAAGG